MPSYNPTELLKQVLSLPTQDKVSEFVQQFLTELGRPFGVDKSGNIFSDPHPEIPKPWFVGHMDTVHRTHVDSQPLRIVEDSNGDWLMAVWNGPDGKGELEQTGIGGDDKVGVWACLMACLAEAEEGSSFKAGVLFPTDEEIGCIGSSAFDVTRASSARCFIQLDRRGSSDAINRTNGIDIWTPKFTELLTPLMEKYGFKPDTGSVTDIGVLASKTGKPSINISSGYHHAHTSKETVHVGQAMNSLRFALDIAEAALGEAGENLGDVREHQKPAPAWSSYGYGGGDIDYSYYGQGRGVRSYYKKKTPLIDALIPDIEEWLSATLAVSKDRVAVVTSPSGVAIYKKGNIAEYPDKFDATGFALDHNDRIKNGFSVDFVDRVIKVVVYMPGGKTLRYVTTVKWCGVELDGADIQTCFSHAVEQLLPHLSSCKHTEWTLDFTPPEDFKLPTGWKVLVKEASNTTKNYYSGGRKSRYVHLEEADNNADTGDYRVTCNTTLWFEVRDGEDKCRFRSYRVVNDFDAAEDLNTQTATLLGYLTKEAESVLKKTIKNLP